MKTASPEIRSIVIKAYQAGLSRQKIAEIVQYHLNSVSRWIREFEREKRLEARPRGHRPSMFSQKELEELTKLIKENVDITLTEIREHFGKNCSLNAIHKHVKALGFVYKKNSEGKRTRTQRYCQGKVGVAMCTE